MANSVIKASPKYIDINGTTDQYSSISCGSYSQSEVLSVQSLTDNYPAIAAWNCGTLYGKFFNVMLSPIGQGHAVSIRIWLK